jgi:hypothetical protein
MGRFRQLSTEAIWTTHPGVAGSRAEGKYGRTPFTTVNVVVLAGTERRSGPAPMPSEWPEGGTTKSYRLMSTKMAA